ncbi:MAG: hypothetical protein SF029_06010 [bacterium]|nr:hypothetical protein [bacterium]
MSIAGFIGALLIAAVFVLWVASPFFQRRRVQVVSNSDTDILERQRERLLVYYNRVLRNIHDLDEDFATGKLDEREYQDDRARWSERGVQALRALDQLDSQHLVAPGGADMAAIDTAIETAIDQRIEEAVRTYRHQTT